MRGTARRISSASAASGSVGFVDQGHRRIGKLSKQYTVAVFEGPGPVEHREDECGRAQTGTARSTPTASTSSAVSRIPAVSASRRVTLPSRTVSSTISRVVPAAGVTMLRSQPARRFIRVDFPTFGLPTMAVSTPSRRIRPASNVSSRRASASSASLRTAARESGASSGISSSGKSTKAEKAA